VSELLRICERVVDDLRRRGLDGSCVVFSRSRSLELEWRDGRVERTQERSDERLGVELYHDGRYAAAGTNDLREEAIVKLLDDLCDLTRILQPDPYRSLPDPSGYARAEVDLDLEDRGFGRGAPAERVRAARELEALVRAAAPGASIVSVDTAVGEARGESARVHSNGFCGVRAGTQFSQYATVHLADTEDRRQLGSAACVRRHQSDLEALAVTAGEAGRRAMARLGAGRLPTGRYPVLVENRAMGRLIRALLAPLSGSSLHQKRSVWDGRLGDKIASTELTLIDEPHRPRGLGSSLWDDDGLGTRRRPLIEGGVLRTYLLDVYSARKLGRPPTSGSLCNIEWAYGPSSLQALMREVGEGVLIDRFIGGNSNVATGELSLGCGGHWIRGGELGPPIAEFNLAGDLESLFGGLCAVGNDPDPNSSLGSPTCVFSSVQLSGS
jgi:PmbA protein